TGRWARLRSKGSTLPETNQWGLKEPFNPVLGELFYGYWPPNAARGAKTTLVVEQVSHHPPIT
ncbi:hypothetical protein EDB19DRAFT_1775865, partial [Suillus lakei]